MFDIILLLFLAFRNGAKAKMKDQNPFLWGLVTLFATFATFMIGFMIVVFGFCRDIVNMNALASGDKGSRDLAQQQIQQAMLSNPLHWITIELFGLGGFLLVRYILDSKPDKKKPEVHWMDRMGEQKSEN